MSLLSVKVLSLRGGSALFLLSFFFASFFLSSSWMNYVAMPEGNMNAPYWYHFFWMPHEMKDEFSLFFLHTFYILVVHQLVYFAIMILTTSPLVFAKIHTGVCICMHIWIIFTIVKCVCIGTYSFTRKILDNLIRISFTLSTLWTVCRSLSCSWFFFFGYLTGFHGVLRAKSRHFGYGGPHWAHSGETYLSRRNTWLNVMNAGPGS